MGRPKPTAQDYVKATSAKEFLDLIGETVQEKVHGEAKNYVSELKGDLSQATFDRSESRQQTENDPCRLDHRYHTNVKNSGENEYPCKSRSNVRFSDTQGAECDNRKIRDNDKKTGGACAPYRRLHICDYNLENINDYGNITNDTLLVDVCLAAKHEGESLKGYHGKHQLTYLGYHSQLCTELARSFADIGDIIRGKDLYRRDKKKDKLQDNLKKIFGIIYDKLLKDNQTNVNTLQERYKDDTDKNYYQLREDWWALNRNDVWKAITCKAGGGTYFRKTCDGGENPTATQGNCQCINGDVPTYFDYVPQYLRWFEEWAEDFCRKKKKKLEKLEQQCRGEYDGKDRYCDRNGFDCERTIYKKGYFVIDKGCNTCSVWCRLYESWIDNQRKQFLKQRNKYQTEIETYTNGTVGSGRGSGRQKRAATIKYEGYEKKFYEILERGEVGGLNKFLEKLSNEEVCKNFKEKEEGTIDFKNVNSGGASGGGTSGARGKGASGGGSASDSGTNDASQGTFYRSKYCEECPLCGVEKKNGNEWEQKNNGECKGGKRYKILYDKNFNGIDVLSFGDKGEDRETKLEAFCKTQNRSDGGGGSGDCGGTNSNSSLCEKWKCYEAKHVQKDGNAQEGDPDYDKDYTNIQNAGGLCILPNPKKNKKEKEKESEEEPEEFQKTFNDFFYFWIRRFLNDSMYWREKVNSCINNAKRKKCKNDCEKLCGCFQRWIKKKKDEWGKIVQHFNKQEGIVQEHGFMKLTHDVVLKTVLNIDELFKDITEAYGNAKELKGIKNMLDEEKKREEEEARAFAGGSAGEDNTTIDKLLQHEAQDAEQCKQKHTKEKCEDPKPEGVARSDTSPSPPAGRSDQDLEDEEEEEVSIYLYKYTDLYNYVDIHEKHILCRCLYH